MTDWLDKHKLPYFLSFGCLLKLIRDNDPYDVDIDLGLFDKYRWKVKKLLKSDPPEGIEINRGSKELFEFLKQFETPTRIKGSIDE